jgi:heme/copper-type cytochrome/quinol oxidase subunit 2
MDVIDLLVTIIVVTILVTIVLGVVTYIAYKLRLARRPASHADGETGLRYFVLHSPDVPGRAGQDAAQG